MLTGRYTHTGRYTGRYTGAMRFGGRRLGMRLERGAVGRHQRTDLLRLHGEQDLLISVNECE